MIQVLLEWTKKENKSLEVMNLFKVPFVTFLFYKVCAQVKPQSTNSELVWEVKVMQTSPGIFTEVNTEKDQKDSHGLTGILQHVQG